MKVLIRYLRTIAQSEEQEESIFEGDRISIGRGSDQDIILTGSNVPLSHSLLSESKAGLKLSCKKGNYCVHDGQLLDSGVFKTGDSFTIAGQLFTISIGDGDLDFIIDINIEPDVEDKLIERYTTKLSELNVSKRGWSWIGFVSVLLVTLFIPLSGLVSPLWMDIVRDSALPDDSIWLSGDLHRSHRFLGDECEQCHAIPFQQVSDKECQACHSNVSHHLDPEYYQHHASVFQNCTSCHKEHSESFDLSLQSQKICASCHRDPEKGGFAHTSYQGASDFEDHHPAFSISMLSPKTDSEIVEWLIKRTPLQSPDAIEVSHLKFPHDLHMSSNGINSPEGRVNLTCANCHEVEPGGTLIQPISMEKHCESCHQLSFDPDDPKRVVPHGSPDEVLQMLREYYGFRYVYKNLLQDDELSDSEIGELFDVRDARRPGKIASEKPTEQLTEQSTKLIEQIAKQGVRTDALQWAEVKAFESASNLFERQACVTCHVVANDPTSEVPWLVLPIQLTKNWMPLATFSHEKHELMNCADCHQVTESKHASDILLPDIDNCRQCHGGEESHNLIPSSCTECHQYHFDEGSLIPDFVKDHQQNAESNSNSGESR